MKTGDICRTYAGDILEWSHVYSSQRDQRAESWSGLSPSGAHLSWGAEPHRGCECWLSWSPPNWDLSTLTSFPAAFSAQLTASPKLLTADLTWPFAPNAAPVMMIIPTQIHDLLCCDEVIAALLEVFPSLPFIIRVLSSPILAAFYSFVVIHKFVTEFPLHYPGYVKKNIGQHNITQLHLIGTKKHRGLVQVILLKTSLEKDWLPENSHRCLLTFILFSSATHLRETSPYLKPEVLLFQ